MREIQRKLAILQTISVDVATNLLTMEAIRAKAEREIEGDGLTPETCAQGAAMMRDIEESARKLYTGSLSVHQSMAKFVPEDANEGPKSWPP